MKTILSWVVIGLAGCALGRPAAGAAVLMEDFSTEPGSHGWQTFGDTNLFHWSPSNKNLEVTWDSSRTNSYFHISFGTVLATNEDFGVSFDLTLSDISIGVDPAKPYTFELAVGFLGWSDATNPTLQRGSGIDPAHGPRNAVEFTYFPDSGQGATISPTLVSSNNQFAVGFDYPLELDPGALFHAAMNYTAATRTLSTSMTRNGQSFGPIQDVALEGGFAGFRLDQLAISSYSDDGADGSLLAHGTMDNIIITTPAPPIEAITGAFASGRWQVQFESRADWLYVLERSSDFQNWIEVSAPAAGAGATMILEDQTPSVGKGFYRVKARKP